MKGRERLPVIYFSSVFTAQTAEMRTAADGRQKKVKVARGSRQSSDLPARLRKAKMLTGSCTCGSTVRGGKERVYGSTGAEVWLLK